MNEGIKDLGIQNSNSDRRCKKTWGIYQTNPLDSSRPLVPLIFKVAVCKFYIQEHWFVN